jgi:hypothetical protein
MNETQTQNTLILAHLKNGMSINPIQALKLFGCFRLGARIYELKLQNPDLNITGEMVKKNKKWFKCYFIKP